VILEQAGFVMGWENRFSIRTSCAASAGLHIRLLSRIRRQAGRNRDDFSRYRKVACLFEIQLMFYKEQRILFRL
jgi:hypothetical protein